MRGVLLVDLRMQHALGRAIRARRKHLRLTQARLATACGADRANIARVEAGRHAVSLGTLGLVARGLCCNMSELVREAELLATGESVQEAAE
jgi:transcriptional regulator with XRE-family HTH domain